MNLRIRRSTAALAAMIALLCAANRSAACTGIRLTAKDGAVVHARTLEFNADLDSNPIIVPRQFTLRGTTASGKPGLVWETKYAAVGMNAQGQTVIVDGVNERGLAGGIFYLPGYAKFETVTPADESRSLGSWELMTWILTNFETVEEVRVAIPEIKVANVAFEAWNFVPPVHYIVHDASGNSLVIEYLDGKLHLYDNPVGVITNSPDFDWHVKNLSNYIALSPRNAAPVNFDGLTITQFGQGSGLLGIPGDFTPASRFVRAAVLGRAALPGDNGPQAVEQAFHVLDSFDIPRGTVRGTEDGQPSYDHTQWTTAADTKNRGFYFHTHDNRRIRKIDLLKADLGAKEVRTIQRHDQEDFEDLTLSRIGG